MLKFILVEELNPRLFERSVNKYLKDGKYRLVNCSITGTSLTKYTAFLIAVEK